MQRIPSRQVIHSSQATSCTRPGIGATIDPGHRPPRAGVYRKNRFERSGVRMRRLHGGWIAIASLVIQAGMPVLAGEEGQAVYDRNCRSCHRGTLPPFPASVEAAREWLEDPGRPHRFRLNEPSLKALLEYWQQQEHMH